MMQRPENYLEGFRQAGAQKVVFHYEAAPLPQEVISLARDLGLEVGLAVKPETPVSAVLPLASEVDGVLFLAVNPGFYGSRFIPEVMDRVKELRSACPTLEIGVDGGINESNIAQVAQAGADVICVGSAIFRQPQPSESFHHLESLIREAPPNGE